MLQIPYQLFNHPPTTPTTLLTCCKFWLVINSIAVHVTLSHFSLVASFSLWQLSLCTKHMWEHPLLYKEHCTRWRGDPQWMWTSRKKRLNTLRRRKKSWTTRDEAHTERTWRYGSRVVGSDVTWRDSKHVTHCPYVTPWHYSLPDKCLGSNVTWYFIQRTPFNLK